MVPLNTPLADSFGRELEVLRGYIGTHWAWPSPEAAFVSYVTELAGKPSPLPVDPWPTAPLHLAPNLAAAGYLFAIPALRLGLKPGEWRDGLTRLSSTDPFPTDRQSFAHRPLELLGIALGATLCPETKPDSKRWLASILQKLHDTETPQDPWPCLVPGLAAHLLGVEWNHQCLRPIYEWDPADLALARWITEHQADRPPAKPFLDRTQDLDRELLLSCAQHSYDPPDIARAAITRQSLAEAVSRHIRSALDDTWQLNVEQRDSEALVTTLCRRFHLFARQLLVRRETRPTLEMTDEYDVQDALHALLLLHFEDVRAEEWTPSYAGNHSRMDFLLKREQIVIEAKMTRATLGQKEVGNQLAVDKERYRAHEDCRTLICLVYDPELRCSNPTALEDDMSEEGEQLRTRVIVAPRGT